MIRLKPIEQQVVVVMGASSGIGRETAHRFAEQGAKVVVSARHKPGLDSLVDEIQRAGGEATAVTADTSIFEQVQNVAAQAVETYGRLDTWVHLAAVSLYAKFMDTDPREFEQVIRINLNGQAYGAMAALPYLMQEGQGALIHVSSVEAIRGAPFHAAYAASKHGIRGFLDALRVELSRDGIPISVTNIMPATINTPHFNKARTKIGAKPKGIPPIYQPELVAETILHAAEHPVSDVYVGGAAKMMAMTQMLSPRLMDVFMERVGIPATYTDEPKSVDGPNNLFEPIDGFNTVHGDIASQPLPGGLYSRLRQSPGLTAGIAGLALGATAALAARGRRPSRALMS